MVSNVNTVSREHCVFLEKFEDDSVYYAAKKKWPETAKKSLAWAKLQKRARPLVDKYIQFDGVGQRTLLVSGLSKKEAQLLKCNLIRNSAARGEYNLNVKEEIDIELIPERFALIQRYCECGYNRALEMTAIFNSLK
ncbi:hypothetical protein [Photobacterium profundum]|uniref:hypothetical protein n=1 Tax=Photobacterium profundum TaxID=74109 RepID=UPI003D0D0952